MGQVEQFEMSEVLQEDSIGGEISPITYMEHSISASHASDNSESCVALTPCQLVIMYCTNPSLHREVFVDATQGLMNL